MNTFNLRLDLDKAPTLPLWVTIRQGDKNGTTISASIYDHGTLLTGSYNARIAFRLPDGEHYYRKDATFSSGVATVTIDETEAASVTGNTVGYFEILSGSTVIASTASFGIHVLQSATEGMTPGENYDSAIQDAIDGLNDAVNALPTTVEGILDDHPEWTTTVQDGSISVPKLASDVRSSLSGAILAAIGGTLVTAHDAAAVPPNALALYGRSTQSGTPTPSSPVAITSVTAAELTLRGANLFPLGDQTFERNTGSSASATTCKFGYAIPAGTYTISALVTSTDTDSTTCVGIIWYEGGTQGPVFYMGRNTRQAATFTATKPFVSMSLYAANNYDNAAGDTSTWADIQIELGSTAHAYVPYQGSTLTIDLQGHELRSLPDGTRDELRVGADGHAVLVQRVQLTTQAVTDGVTGTVGVNVMSSTGEIANGATVLYKLATPVTIDLGYVTLPTLPAPDLTAWAAQGAELGITYQRDATLVIAGIYAQLAPVDGPTATSNHGVGTYLMLGGTLCKVTTAIAVGEQITIGTNVVATTVMTEILALTA